MFTIPDTVKAISFDIWGTLLRGNPAFTWPRLKMVIGFLSTGLLQHGEEALVQAYRQADRECNLRSEETGLDIGLSPRITRMCELLDYPAITVGTATVNSLQRNVAMVRTEPRYIPRLTEDCLPRVMLQLQRRGFQLGCLSNTGMGDHQTVIPVLDFYGFGKLLSVQLFSSQTGLAKPNPEFFRMMVERFGCKPHEVLHIGDSPSADYAATKAGLQAVLYAPEGSNLPHIRSMEHLMQVASVR